ncbi:uncharacterized protein LOC117809108 [Notolabrus celidotus]|uniref:uncharacterized protein LOC117809108 n=1 Tax=Notolabrus celidotus TaxID=1203425 RepID=UPI001490864E|nr:uncharacterized protein LOC117809108 [Notolabrus celidotus]
MNQRMSSCGGEAFFLRSSTAVSLNERFSQVISEQLDQPTTTVTFDPTLLQRSTGGDAQQMVLLMKREQPAALHLQTQVSCVPPLRVKQVVRRKGSVWTRLGWQRGTRVVSAFRPSGFWSFRNKYRRSAGFTSTCRSGGNQRHQQGEGRFKRHAQKLSAGPTQPAANPQRGGASWNRRGVTPTRKQLDADLDKYMSLSKRRLDQQLDEYMCMAGQTDLTWD